MKGSIKKEITPMFQQYLEIKNRYPDTILFFRLGDFYEMFFEDAETVAPLLGLVLTKREAGSSLTAPMCGIPIDKSSFYIQKLVNMGFKVAICEQIEDPALAKGLVKREVVKIYTPGLLIDLDALKEKEKNYLASIYIDKKAGLAFLELSCGEFIFTEIDKNTFLAEILKKEPREIILSKKLEKSSVVSTLTQILPKTFLTFIDENNFKKLQIPEFEKFEEGIKAFSAILEYLKIYQPYLVDKIENPSFYYPEEFLFLDEATKRNLELTKNLWDGSEKYSLFWLLDKTSTPMGSRLLKEWILYPLKDVKKIQKRQEAIKFFIKNKFLEEEIKKSLKKISDLERLSVRCALKLITPKELGILRESLKQLPEIKNVLQNEKGLIIPEEIKEIFAKIEDFSELIEFLDKALVKDPPYTLKEGGIINKGFNKELDELLELKENAIFYLSELEKKERQKTGITTLRIGYNRVFGYYFEISKSYIKMVPSYFERKQTLANVERFITPELKELENKILFAEEKIKNLEYELFLEIREKVSQYKERLKTTSHLLAKLDVYISLARVSIENEYTVPEIVEEPVIIIEEGRHPVLEKIQGKEKFIPNSLEMNKDDALFLIITGPNMGGKSTYLRQNALIVIMAQMGSLVPAKFAKIGICDRVFSRIGAGDQLIRGKSTFMVEMNECAYILKNATPRSLVILDELGRGTSTYDGMSLAWAIAENLYHKKIFTLLATHYYELTELSKLYIGIKNYHVSVKEWNGEIIFLYKLLPGATTQSYGIEVAKLAGIPQEVIDRAKEILYKLENKSLKEKKEFTMASKKIYQLPIFRKEHFILEKIKNLDLENMSPLSALNLLWEFKKELSSQEKKEK